MEECHRLCHEPSCLLLITGDRRRLCCSRCQFVNYCSERCQRKNWTVHKAHCIDRATASIFAVGNMSYTCPVGDRAHSHPTVAFTESQITTAENLVEMITKLDPKERRYRLSCRCNVHVTTVNGEFLLGFWKDKRRSRMLIYAYCKNSGCRLHNVEPWYLLTVNFVPEFEDKIFICCPANCKNISIVSMLTNNCPVLDSVPAGYRLDALVLSNDRVTVVAIANDDSEVLRIDPVTMEWIHLTHDTKNIKQAYK